jgi:hypothetical protein
MITFVPLKLQIETRVLKNLLHLEQKFLDLIFNGIYFSLHKFLLIIKL